MIPVQWRDPEPEWFETWKIDAATETKTAVTAKLNGKAYEFNPHIWTKLKNHLAALFNNKCAYCESKIKHVMPGDIEHFRPKSKVTECPDHPGYYWLAYEPLNLLLSCELCNRSGGKMNHFPVTANCWRRAPADAHVEMPLLLNPYIDQPTEHIAFAPVVGDNPVGTIKGITERGKETVRICRLDRPELNEERRAAQRAALDRLRVMVVSGNLGQARDELISGQYSAACLTVAEGWIENIKKQWG